MPLYEFICPNCGYTFELIQKVGEPYPCCPQCGHQTQKLISPVAFKVKDDAALRRVERRFNDYLRWGKYKDAARFAKKASEYLKHDKIKRMQEKIENKLSQSQSKGL